MPHTIQYQNYQIAAYSEGNGAPLVFLHGWPTNAQLWAAQVDALKHQYRVITLDWLGFGQSDKPVDFDYTFTHQKEILDTVLTELIAPDEKVTLVGHDIGGPPTILWASENPDHVQRLILLNTVLYTLKTPLDAFSEILLSLPVTKDIFVSPFGLRQVLKTNTKSRSKALNNKIETLLAPYKTAPGILKRKTLEGPMHHGRSNELLRISEQFRQLDTEKHLVIAKRDPLCYAHIKRLSEENPEVPAHYLDNCGHFIPIDQPEQLSNILLNILSNA